MSEEYDYYGEKLTTIANEECTEMMEAIIDGVDYESRPLTDEEINRVLKKIHGHAEDSKILFAEHLKEPYREDWVKREDEDATGSIKFRSALTENDISLLTKYAPLLFNTSTSKNVKQDMYALVKLVWKYRLHRSPNFGVNYVIDNSLNHYQNWEKEKRKQRIEKTLIDSLKTALKIMGGNTISTNHNINYNDEENEIIENKDGSPSAHQVKKILQMVIDNPNDYIPTEPPKPKADKKTIEEYLISLKLKGKSSDIEAFTEAIKE